MQVGECRGDADAENLGRWLEMKLGCQLSFEHLQALVNEFADPDTHRIHLETLLVELVSMSISRSKWVE